MPTLYILSGSQIGKTFELRDGCVLGRAPTCDSELAIPLRESSVSRDHARVEREGDRWFLVDLKSSNGTHFGGLRVQREELAGQVDFQLGELELRVRVDSAPASTPVAPKSIEPSFDELEIELEEEIELESEPVAAPPPSPRPRPVAPRPAAPERPALQKTRLTPSASPEEPVVKRKILQYNRVENRSGLFTTEMSQWPPLVQFLMVIFAVAVVAGLGYGAFLAAQVMRG